MPTLVNEIIIFTLSFSVGGGFVVNEKTKVGENLFYKGVDKRAVHGARLHQTHSLTDPATHPTSIHSPALETGALSTNDDEAQNTSVMAGRTPDPMDEPFDPEAEHPPYPFVSGNSLLALTHKHNVRCLEPPVTYIPTSIPRIDRRSRSR